MSDTVQIKSFPKGVFPYIFSDPYFEIRQIQRFVCRILI